MISGAAALAGLCSAAAVLAATAGDGRRSLRRLRRLHSQVALSPQSPQSPQSSKSPKSPEPPAEHAGRVGPSRSRLVSLLAGSAAWQLVGGLPGVVVGVTTVVVLPRLIARLEPAAVRADRARLSADLPVALDLLAACLAAGADPHRGLALVAEAVGGPLGRRLSVVAAQVRLGADPVRAWAELGDLPGMASLARSIARSLESGAAWAPVLEHASRDLRARRRLAGEAAARAVAVKAVAPLGACFLPAFVLLGVVPTVWGIAASTFSGRF